MSEYRYSVLVEWDENRQRYVATSPGFQALTAYGKTHAEAAENLRDAVIEHADPPDNEQLTKVTFWNPVRLGELRRTLRDWLESLPAESRRSAPGSLVAFLYVREDWKPSAADLEFAASLSETAA